MAVAPDPVVDDPRDVHPAPVGREPVDDGGGGAGHRARIDHQHDRPAEGGGGVRGRALVEGRAVEEAHDPFGDDEAASREAAASAARNVAPRMAHGSALKHGRPLAAAWKAGSM